MERKMKKICISLITALSIAPLGLSANESIDTNTTNIKTIVNDNNLTKIDTNTTKLTVYSEGPKQVIEEVPTIVKDNNIIELSIDKLIKEVVKRNPNMIFDRMQSQIIQNQLIYEDSIFTPQFYANFTHQKSDTPNNTEATISKGYLSTYSEKTNNIQMGMQGLLSSGAKWNTSLKSNDRQSSLIEKYKNYDTEYDNAVELSITQPILKGFGEDSTRSRYNLARADQSIFDKQYEKKLVDMMGSVIQTYWKFYGAKQLQKSYEQSISINKQTIKLLEQKVKSGDIAYSEVLEARSAMMIREADLQKMRSEVSKIKNDIFTLLNVSVELNEDIIFDLIDDYNSNSEQLTVDEYYKEAIYTWPEFAIAKERLKKEEIQLKATTNEIKPQLDFVATASTTTLDDERSYKFTDTEFLTWSVGLQFSIPIFDDQSKSVMNMAKLKKKQVELEIKTLDKGLYNAISTKLDSLLKSEKQVSLYQDGLNLKQELYEYMQKSFLMGEKSIKDVLTQEEDILEYKRKLFGTIIDWKLSQASLDKAVGTLFDNYLTKQDLDSIKDREYTDKLSNDSFGEL